MIVDHEYIKSIVRIQSLTSIYGISTLEKVFPSYIYKVYIIFRGQQILMYTK